MQQQQNKYESAKRAIRRREEKRIAQLVKEGKVARANAKEYGRDSRLERASPRLVTVRENAELIGADPLAFESDSTAEDVVDNVENGDDTSSDASIIHQRPRLDSEDSSVTTVTNPETGVTRSSRSLFVSALSHLETTNVDDS